MAYIAQGTITSGVSWQRTPTFGNSEAKTLIIGPKSTATGGASIPTEGLIWWPRK